MQNTWLKKAMAAAAFGVAATPVALGQAGGPVQQDDIALGLSNGNAALTAELVRGGALQGNWTFTAFLQSMEFDNLGTSHNARGNLLSLNFGSSGTGGTLWSLATDGTDTGSQIYAFDGTNETMTRVTGLSVSPDNSKAAVMGYDTGSLIILDYTAGNGTGNGSVAPNVEVAAVGKTFETHGTDWLDDNTVLAAVLDPAEGEVDVYTYDISGAILTNVASISGLQVGSEFIDIDYNAGVSPYVYISFSSFSGSTSNLVTVFDPADWSVVDDVDLSGSANTLREIALGFDGTDPALYIGQFGGSIDILNLAGVGSLVDDSSVDYYTSATGGSFNGLDVALTETVAGPTTVAVTELLNSAFGADDGFEWVEIYNYGSEVVNLDGWTISDEDSDTWTITGGVTVDPDDFVILVGGNDSLTAEEKKQAFEGNWLGGTPDARVFGIDTSWFLSNSGDEVILTDPLGATVWSLSYHDDEVEGESTFLATEDYSIRTFGNKAAPGIVRNGFDNGSSDFFGYETQGAGNIVDNDAYVGVNGDTGSPFARWTEPEDCLVLDVTDLIPGEDVTFDLSFGTPGTIVVLVYGTQEGTSTFASERLGICATFGIKGVKTRNAYAGFVVLDGAGTGSIVRQSPFKSGLTLLFQGAEFDTCPDECVSNLVERTVQ